MSTPVSVERPPSPGSRTDRLVAHGAFLLAVVILRLPFRRQVAAVGWLKRRCARRATLAEAEAAVAAARHAARWYPGRAACLELSLTAVLTAILRGRAVDWCIGVSVRPLASHAWVAVAGSPVAEPPTTDAYHPILTV